MSDAFISIIYSLPSFLFSNNFLLPSFPTCLFLPIYHTSIHPCFTFPFFPLVPFQPSISPSFLSFYSPCFMTLCFIHPLIFQSTILLSFVSSYLLFFPHFSFFMFSVLFFSFASLPLSSFPYSSILPCFLSIIHLS